MPKVNPARGGKRKKQTKIIIKKDAYRSRIAKSGAKYDNILCSCDSFLGTYHCIGSKKKTYSHNDTRLWMCIALKRLSAFAILAALFLVIGYFFLFTAAKPWYFHISCKAVHVVYPICETILDYHGCYKQPTSTGAHAKSFPKREVLKENTPEACRVFCGSTYEYIGVKGDICFCGYRPRHTDTKYEDRANCDVNCTADATAKCGGPLAYDLYRQRSEFWYLQEPIGELPNNRTIRLLNLFLEAETLKEKQCYGNLSFVCRDLFAGSYPENETVYTRSTSMVLDPILKFRLETKNPDEAVPAFCCDDYCDPQMLNHTDPSCRLVDVNVPLWGPSRLGVTPMDVMSHGTKSWPMWALTLGYWFIFVLCPIFSIVAFMCAATMFPACEYEIPDWCKKKQFRDKPPPLIISVS